MAGVIAAAVPCALIACCVLSGRYGKRRGKLSEKAYYLRKELRHGAEWLRRIIRG